MTVWGLSEEKPARFQRGNPDSLTHPERVYVSEDLVLITPPPAHRQVDHFKGSVSQHGGGDNDNNDN